MTDKLEELKINGEAPEWMKDEGYTTLCGGYLLPNETPKGMYRRVAKAAASYYSPEAKYEEKFFHILWNNWLCLASPIAANLGSDRALPVSCNSLHLQDSIDSIFMKNHELAILSKNGAGVGIFFGDLRSRGKDIKGNGKAEGVVPWAKVMDSSIVAVSQGSQRKGAAAIYLPVEHGDIEEFLNIRRQTGDMNRRCLNINIGVTITDAWMESMLAGDKNKRKIWESILTERVETGEPYIFFSDNVNKNNPECYKQNNLKVSTSNICCLSGDTLIATKNGPKKISSLIDQTVEIYDGKKWVENSSFKLRGYDSLTRIHLADGSFVDSNDKHRWFISKNYTDIRNNKFHETLTKDLEIGNYVEFHKQESHGNIAAEAAYAKGFLIGDGTSSETNTLLNLHFTKFMCEEEIISSVLEINPSKANTNANIKVAFSDIIDNTGSKGSYGKQIFKRLKGLSLRKSLHPWSREYKKSLPDEVRNWNRKSKIKFLSGLLDADGTVCKNTIQITSIYEQFILDLGSMLKTCAITYSMDKSNLKYRITISANDTVKLKDELSCKRLNFENCKKPNRFLTTFRKIVKIEKLEGVHPVYCPTVPSTGKFALANGLMTGNSEITLYTDPDHTFVCCLSSLNLVRWDEWKDTDTVNLAVRFLDAVLSEYIQKTENMTGMEAARRSAIKGRAIGIGVLGWHTLLQEQMLPMDSFEVMQLNAEIFKSIDKKSLEESKVLAQELGEPEWCKGFGIRNTHRIACAPTVSNSTISGGYSAGIEPIAANIVAIKSAKGTFIRKNPTLERLLESKGFNTIEVWQSINEQSGGVQHLKFLSDLEKEVFLTAREINQHVLIKLGAQRQKWIDQAQSLNLFFASNSSAKYIHDVHIAAWKSGLKTLYYLRSEGVLKGDMASRGENECKACEG
jgi:ribonucleoside-diphosphate reductase alpha chain